MATDLDNEFFLPIARQLGEQDEAIRDLLADAEHKRDELETIKRAIGKLVEPVNQKLRTLDEVSGELGTAKNQITTLEGECVTLRKALAEAQQKSTALEAVKAEQATDLAARHAQIADLQSRLLQQTGELQAARDESHNLSERLTAADRQKLQLESDGAAARQKLTVAEKERSTVQASLDKAYADIAQMSQRLLDAEKTVAAAQTGTQDSERMLAAMKTERDQLAMALDDLKQKHQSETASQKIEYEALLGRMVQTEKLLDDMRRSMKERAEEIQSFNRRLAESLQPPGAAQRATEGQRAAEAPRPVAPNRPLESRLQPVRTFPDDRHSQPVVERRGMWRTDFFDWLGGKFGS